MPSFWDVDAITVNPYLGEDSLQPFFEEAKRRQRSVCLDCTTNPSAPFIQMWEKKVFILGSRLRLVEKWGRRSKGERGI